MLDCASGDETCPSNYNVLVVLDEDGKNLINNIEAMNQHMINGLSHANYRDFYKYGPRVLKAMKKFLEEQPS